MSGAGSRLPARDFFLTGALLCACAALLLWPMEASGAVRDGLALCGSVLIPALFPFFVLSSLVVELGLCRYPGLVLEKLMRPLFRVNGACAGALILGLVGGYPVGARTAVSLYESGQCSKTEAQRLLAFCNNAGPAFIFGVVGFGIFASGRAALLLYLCHITASLLVGFLFRFYRPKDLPRSSGSVGAIRTVSFPKAFTGSVTGALSSMLNLCAFVLVFCVISRCLSRSGVIAALSGVLAGLFSPLGLTQPEAAQLLMGLLELSSGVTALTGGTSGGALPMAAFMLGWAGLCVHAQVMSLLSDSGLSMGTYLAGKLLHGVFAALLTGWAAPCLHLSGAVQAGFWVLHRPAPLFSFAAALPALCCLAFFLLCAAVSKKRSGKP